MQVETSIDPVAECSVLIRFNTTPSPELSWAIGQVSHYLHNQFSAWVMNITPSFDSILVDYLPHRISVYEFIPYLEKSVTDSLHQLTVQSEQLAIELPVYYHPEVGPDLNLYFNKDMSLDEIIQLHSSIDYSVGAIGFTAGFAFLTEVNEKLYLPRRNCPRLSVSKGSVAIANNQTAVYPSSSPGGWNIIGNCPIDLYDPTNPSILPFSIGSRIRFQPIQRKEFLALGGIIEDNRK